MKLDEYANELDETVLPSPVVDPIPRYLWTAEDYAQEISQADHCCGTCGQTKETNEK